MRCAIPSVLTGRRKANGSEPAATFQNAVSTARPRFSVSAELCAKSERTGALVVADDDGENRR